HRQRLEVNRARQAVEDLEYRFMSVDPANRLVAAGLGSKLEQAKRGLQRFRQKSESDTPAVALFDEDAFTEIVAHGEELPGLWHASTTLDQDRKQIIRSIVKVVKIEGRTLEKIFLRIVWVDDAEDTKIEVALNRHGHQIAWQLAAEGE